MPGTEEIADERQPSRLPELLAKSGTPRTAGGKHRRRRLGHVIGASLSHANRVVERLPPGRWIRRWLHESTEFSNTDIHLRRGAAGLDGLTIAFLSDLHAGHFMTRLELRRLAERVAQRQPDLVCLGGDLINTRVDELRNLEPLWELISPKLGMFAVPGNHDYFRPGFGAPWHSLLADRGVQVLTNRGVRVEREGASLWLCGVDDLTEGTPNLDAALAGRDRDEPTLLLSHHPDLFIGAAARGVDLQLSGHTHGGQICLFGWAPLRRSAHGYLHGHHARGDAQLYVGRGLGVSLAPIRLGARPELPMLRLRTG